MEKCCLILLVLFIFCGCETYQKTDECNNRITYLNCVDESIPIFDFDLSKNAVLLDEEFYALYPFELDTICDWVSFRYPIKMKGLEWNQKIWVDTRRGIGCPTICGITERFDVVVNMNDDMLVEGEISNLITLQVQINNYLNKLDDEELRSFKYAFHWHRKTSPEMVDSIIYTINQAHLMYVEEKLKENNQFFCELSDSQLDSVKNVYPISIEMPYFGNDFYISYVKWNRHYSIDNYPFVYNVKNNPNLEFTSGVLNKPSFLCQKYSDKFYGKYYIIDKYTQQVIGSMIISMSKKPCAWNFSNSREKFVQLEIRSNRMDVFRDIKIGMTVAQIETLLGDLPSQGDDIQKTFNVRNYSYQLNFEADTLSKILLTKNCSL